MCTTDQLAMQHKVLAKRKEREATLMHKRRK